MASRTESVVDRSKYDAVLTVMRRLGGCAGLDETLSVIANGVVDVLGFGAAAVNVTTPEGDLRVEAVVGPDGIEWLLGQRTPMSFWQEFLGAAEPWGELRYFSREHDQALADRYPSWSPDEPVTLDADPEAWHPDDELIAPLWDDAGQLIGVLSVDLPVTGRRPDPEQRMVLEVFAHQAGRAIREAQARGRADSARQEVESLWRAAFEQTPTGVVLLDRQGTIIEANEAIATFLGYPRATLPGMNAGQVVVSEDIEAEALLFRQLVDGVRSSYTLEKRYVRADGSIVHGLLHAGVMTGADGAVHTVVGQITDITQRKTAESRLAYQLTHDELTGLRNRPSVDVLLSERLSAGETVVVLFCDVDRFKTINDSLGRVVGDEVLAAVARRIQDALPDCALGRVGDDEFVVIETLPATRDDSAAQQLAARLLAALDVPLAAAGVRLAVSVCVGVAVSEPRHRHADELLADAEQAMRRAKRAGRNRVEFFDPDHDRAGTRQDLELEQTLRVAIRTATGLGLWLQPIVDVVDERAVGGEALVRWDHPNRGLLTPADFLPIAEHSGLMGELGGRILLLGAAAAAYTDSWIAINVSGSQLGNGLLPGAVRRALDQVGTHPERLFLEVTETVLVDASSAVVRELHEVAELGVGIALDDFGTGYSSLSLLRDLPISIVKIDKSFTGPMVDNPRTAALVQGLVAMCKALGIRTVAEGVETPQQFDLVRRYGCDMAQGFLFGEPKPWVSH